MLRGEDFTVAVRRGARAGNRRLVIHYSAGETGGTTPALVGVVVPKKQVARATHRNRIKRRIRAIMRERMDRLEPGARVVVRGLSGADGASSEILAADVESLMRVAKSKAESKNRYSQPRRGTSPARSAAGTCLSACGRDIGDDIGNAVSAADGCDRDATTPSSHDGHSELSIS